MNTQADSELINSGRSQVLSAAAKGIAAVGVGSLLPVYPTLGGASGAIRPSFVEEAERLCPYSKATRGNIDVVFKLV